MEPDAILTVDISRLMLPAKFLLGKLNLWFESSDCEAHISRPCLILRKVFTTFILLCMTLFSLLTLANIFTFEKKSLREATFVAVFVVRQFSSLQKCFILKLRAQRIRKLFRDAFDCARVPSMAQQEFDAFAAYCSKTQKLIVWVAVAAIAHGPIWIISIFTIFTLAFYRGKAFQFSITNFLTPVWLPSDQNQNPTAKYVLFGLNVLCVHPFLLVMVGFFAFYVLNARLGLFMFKHLNAVLQSLQTINIAENLPGVKKEALNEKVNVFLTYAVINHNRSLAFIREVNKIFGSTMLVDVWGILLVQCSWIFLLASTSSLPFLRQVDLVQNILIMTSFLGVSCFAASDISDMVY
ncbi:Hypothetical predicted protein [Cloeon dipterum]|uniref:Odorant receptor n=1 Tax=Cloeon dipterum TaxID=197152 RepID=A0A8S1CJU4_9INSE|nr:Hypothetical predicted protein [Cloeon dipterum]